MKFLLFMLPVVPATREERRRLRPIAANTERFQMMIDQVVETARVADDLGFDMLSFPEHFLQTEGLEMGATPSLYAHVAAHTRNIKLGPMGFVLPGWNPLRLACEVGWLDQITRGRVFVGLARGYQTRWLNPMAQRLQISATLSDQSEIDKANREAFDEVLFAADGMAAGVEQHHGRAEERSDGVDNHGVAFPVADRMAVPGGLARFVRRGMPAAVEVDDVESEKRLVQEHELRRSLHNLHGNGRVHGSRIA